jgi:hypothetical protein
MSWERHARPRLLTNLLHPLKDGKPALARYLIADRQPWSQGQGAVVAVVVLAALALDLAPKGVVQKRVEHPAAAEGKVYRAGAAVVEVAAARETGAAEDVVAAVVRALSVPSAGTR